MHHDKRKIDDLGVDANGRLTERLTVGGQDVVIHYDDIPETDITTINGLRCTTPLRTIIDIAPDLDGAELERMVHHCLDRRLFTVAEATERAARPDMRGRPGASLLLQIVTRSDAGD
jgi:hypothetical protein